MGKPKVLLADDHTLVLQGFRKLLEDQCELVGMVKDGRALLEAAPRLQPDLIILDIGMPLLNGIDATRQLKTLLSAVKIIVVTMHADTAYVRAAFQAGASGYLLKSSASDELEQAIRAVSAGNCYLTPLIAKDVIASLLSSPAGPSEPGEQLTTRQREVLQLLTEGHSAKEIANILKISPRTVEFHKSQIMGQLNLRTTAELIKFALTRGLITASS